MIKFLIMDVDGTLTDGQIYMSDGGELFKSFNIKDGCGIKDILPMYGIIPIIITARESILLENRCAELGIQYCFQGVTDKRHQLEKIIDEYNIENRGEYTFADCAYIGDDILDLQCMEPIKADGGIVGCPRDAVKRVLEVSEFVSEYSGGNGAVRDFIEYLVIHDR